MTGKAHMASLVLTVSGEYLPSPYAVCGAWRPPLMTTRPVQIGCVRCNTGRGLAAAKRAAQEAPLEARFDITPRTQLSFATEE